jgi:hypothetical protein
MCQQPGCDSSVLQQGFEPIIHVVLDVAVKQRGARLIGREVDDSATVHGHNDGIFDDP